MPCPFYVWCEVPEAFAKTHIPGKEMNIFFFKELLMEKKFPSQRVLLPPTSPHSLSPGNNYITSSWESCNPSPSPGLHHTNYVNCKYSQESRMKPGHNRYNDDPHALFAAEQGFLAGKALWDWALRGSRKGDFACFMIFPCASPVWNKSVRNAERH